MVSVHLPHAKNISAQKILPKSLRTKKTNLKNEPPLKSEDQFECGEVKSKKFAKTHHKSDLKGLEIFYEAKRHFGKPLKTDKKRPGPQWEAVAQEEKFIKNPNFKDYLSLVHDFEDSMLVVGHQKYVWMDEVLLNPSCGSYKILDREKFLRLELWHKKQTKRFEKHEDKALAKTDKRLEKIAKHGPGLSGKMTHSIEKTRNAAYFAKNNFTMRGNVFKITHEACPKNVFEIMPRYGYRKGAHIGVRVTQFTLNAILSAIGYAMMPVTFGISKIVTNHLSTVVTLSGETITNKVAGADKKKISVHNSLRGAQLTIPNVIPIAGNFITIAESGSMGVAALGIVSTFIADAILNKCSTRYQSVITREDLGDSKCLGELDKRIDYLSRFLLPYGQYLLLKETNVEHRKKLKENLKVQFKSLRSLEKKKVESLNYYRLALVAEQIPKELVHQVSSDCRISEPHINTHRIVKRCLRTLIENDEDLHNLVKKKDPSSIT